MHDIYWAIRTDWGPGQASVTPTGPLSGKVMEWVFAIGDEFDIPNGEHRKVTEVGVDNVLTEGGPFVGALPFYWVRKYATNLRRAK